MFPRDARPPHEHVPALQRPLEARVGMTRRARNSSFRGPVSQVYEFRRPPHG